MRTEYAEGHEYHGDIDYYEAGELVRTEYAEGHEYHGRISYFDAGDDTEVRLCALLRPIAPHQSQTRCVCVAEPSAQEAQAGVEVDATQGVAPGGGRLGRDGGRAGARLRRGHALLPAAGLTPLSRRRAARRAPQSAVRRHAAAGDPLHR